MITPEELPAVSALAAAVCDIIVVAAGVFWGSVERSPGRLHFSRADAIVDFARLHGKKIRGHPLVSHESLPIWLPDAVKCQDPKQVLASHISKVVQHFGEHVAWWDVVNEPLMPEHGLTNGLRNELWMKTIGPGYIEFALRTARDASPLAKLGINEYGLEDDSPRADARRAAALSMLKTLTKSAAPLDFLGIQGHLSASFTYSARRLGTFLRQVEDLGISVMVTELDFNDAELPADVEVRDRAAAEAYSRFLDVVYSSVRPTMVNTWGLSDRYSWHQTFHPRPDGLPQRPLPFDANLRAKPAWDVLVGDCIAPQLSR